MTDPHGSRDDGPAVVGTSTEAAGSSDTSDMVQRPGGVGCSKESHGGPWWMSISSSSESSEDNDLSEVSESSLLRCGDRRVRVAATPVDGSDSSSCSSHGVQEHTEFEHKELPLPPEEDLPPLEKAMLRKRASERCSTPTRRHQCRSCDPYVLAS